MRAGICDLFGFCNLDPDPMTFIYELDLYSLEIYRICKYELATSRHSKYRQTQPKLYTMPFCRWSMEK